MVIGYPYMKLDRPLDDLFATGSHIRVLRALAALPGSAGASGREVARRAGVSAPTARDALASLVDQGLVRVARSLGSASYRLDADHVLAPLVYEMFARERGMRDALERDLSAALRRLGDIETAYLFGSAARGDMLPHSDIDVAVTSSKAVPEENADLERLQRKYGNRVNVIRLRPRAGAGLRERIEAEGKPLPLRQMDPR